MKKAMVRVILFVIALSLVLGIAASGWAQEMKGSEILPGLVGKETQVFEADSMAKAKEICDKVAKQNNFESCTTRSAGPPATMQERGAMVWYCLCK